MAKKLVQKKKCVCVCVYLNRTDTLFLQAFESSYKLFNFWNSQRCPIFTQVLFLPILPLTFSKILFFHRFPSHFFLLLFTQMYITPHSVCHFYVHSPKDWLQSGLKVRCFLNSSYPEVKWLLWRLKDIYISHTNTFVCLIFIHNVKTNLDDCL